MRISVHCFQNWIGAKGRNCLYIVFIDDREEALDSAVGVSFFLQLKEVCLAVFATLKMVFNKRLKALPIGNHGQWLGLLPE